MDSLTALDAYLFFIVSFIVSMPGFLPLILVVLFPELLLLHPAGLAICLLLLEMCFECFILLACFLLVPG